MMILPKRVMPKTMTTMMLMAAKILGNVGNFPAREPPHDSDSDENILDPEPARRSRRNDLSFQCESGVPAPWPAKLPSCTIITSDPDHSSMRTSASACITSPGSIRLGYWIRANTCCEGSMTSREDWF